MKNLKKIAAIVLAATMCLGVSATAFASGPSQEGVEDPAEDGVFYISATDINGKPVPGLTLTDARDMTKEQHEKYLYDLCSAEGLAPELVSKILEQNGFEGVERNDGLKLIAVSITDAEIKGGTPEGGVTLLYSPDENVKNIKEGDTVYVFHKKHNGEWEVKEATVGKDGFSVTLDELSPVIVIKFTKDGRTLVLNKKTGKSQYYSSTTGEPVKAKTSPQTGE